MYIHRNLTVTTLRQINTGEELSYNYGLPYWFAPGNKYLGVNTIICNYFNLMILEDFINSIRNLFN